MSSNVASNVIKLFYRHQFDATSPHIKFLDSAGGFSGALFWKIVDDRGEFGLRRWPIQASQDEPRLQWTHRQLARAYSAGCDFVPNPLTSVENETLVEHHGHLWQLEPWMPGQASFQAGPSETKLVGAMEALAQFHLAVRTRPSRSEPSPGVLKRVERLAALFDGSQPTSQFLEIESVSTDQSDSGIRELASRICMQFRNLAEQTHQQLNSVKSTPVEIQTIIGDIWHDHVLFTEDRVTGVVDFGAMRMDTPAADIARLLGSLVGESVSFRLVGLNAYRSAAPEIECKNTRLIEAIDHSTTVLAGINWLQWLCIEHRQFADMGAVWRRLQMIARRMDFLAACL